MSGLRNSLVRRLLTFFAGLFECLCFAGVVFGWASLVFILKTEGYFSSLCVNTTGVNETQELVSQYTNAFALTQLCTILCSPWNGLIMDRHKGKPRAEGESEQEADLRSSVLSLFLTALLNLVFSVCATIPMLPLQYFTFVIQVLNNVFLHGGNTAFISVAFPSCHFGTLYGLIRALSAVFSLLQYACFALVNGPLNGDPLYVNITLTLLSLLAFLHPVSVFLHCRSLASQRATNVSS